MAKKGKKGKNMFSFKDIFKATIYFKISDTIIAFFTLIIILLAVFGYYLVQKSIKLEKQLDTNNNTNNTNSNNTVNSIKIKFMKYIGYTLMIVFGILSILILLPIIINSIVFFLVDYGMNEAFSD